MKKFAIVALTAVLFLCSCLKESDSIVIYNEGLEIIGLTVSSKGAEIPIQLYSSGPWECFVEGTAGVTVNPKSGGISKDKATDITITVPENTGDEGLYANLSFETGKSNAPLLIFQTCKQDEEEEGESEQTE